MLSKNICCVLADFLMKSNSTGSLIQEMANFEYYNTTFFYEANIIELLIIQRNIWKPVQYYTQVC